MSNGNIIGGIIGAIAGFFLGGGPQGAIQGFYVGYTVGGLIDPEELDPVEGPRLEDLEVQRSEYGTFIPRVYNSDTLSGSLIWVENNKLEEYSTTRKVGGGGMFGGEQKIREYHYRATFAVAIAEGPISGISRIWANEELIYDLSQSSDILSSSLLVRVIAAAGEYKGKDPKIPRTIFYPGDSTQLPDERMEAEFGEGNVPAYRGVAYVAFYNFELEDFGNQIPQLRFEVVDNERVDPSRPNFYDMSAYLTNMTSTTLPAGIPISSGGFPAYERTAYPWYFENGIMHLINWSTKTTVGQVGMATGCYDDPGNPWWGGCDTTISQMPFNYFTAKSIDDFAETDHVERFDSLPWDIPGGCYDYETMYVSPIDNAPGLFLLGYQSIKEYPNYYIAIGLRKGNGLVRYYRLEPRASTYSLSEVRASYRSGKVYICKRTGSLFPDWDDRLFVFDVTGYNPVQAHGYYDLAGGFDEYQYLKELVKVERAFGSEDNIIGGLIAWGVDPYSTRTFAINRDPANPYLYEFDEELNQLQKIDISALRASPYDGTWSERFAVRDNKIYISIYHSGDTEYKLACIEVGTGTATLNWADTLTSSGAGNVLQRVIDIHYDMWFMGGNIPPGYSGGSWGYFAIFTGQFPLSTTGYTLPEVVEDELARIDILTSSDYDVSGLDADLVRGYTVSSLGATRNALVPLQQAFRFDVYEEDYQLKFRTRGSTASRVTIPESKLQAREIGGDVPPVLVRSIPNPNETPGRLEINYRSNQEAREKAFAYADRLSLDRTAVVKMEIPITMSPDEAYQTAEILLLDTERVSKGRYRFTTTFEYSYLVKSDVVTVTTTEKEYLFRIENIEMGKPGIVIIDAIEEDLAAYTSSASGDSGVLATSSLGNIPMAYPVDLDIPALRAVDDDPGTYKGMEPIGEYDEWEGGVLFSSKDDGASWDSVAGITTGLKTGIASNVLVEDDYTIYTYNQDLEVTMLNGTLETKTLAQVKAGANLLAYGRPGAWELLKFVNATDNGSGQYTLSGLLRGQFGTDWVMGNHNSGDRVILIEEDAIRRVALTEYDYTTPILYTVKSARGGSSPVTSSSSGAVAKIPHAPEHVKGHRDASLDLTITWIPRGRYNFQWANGVGQPLTESDIFDIEILDGDTTVRTIESTAGTHSVTYTAAEQITDFGTEQSSVKVRIYQQTTFGTITRGYFREETI